MWPYLYYMCACMYVCMHACTNECMSVCLYVCMHQWMNEWMNEFMYHWMYVCTYVCMYVCMYVCNVPMNEYMHVCMHACMHACAYVRMNEWMNVWYAYIPSSFCLSTIIIVLLIHHPHLLICHYHLYSLSSFSFLFRVVARILGGCLKKRSGIKFLYGFISIYIKYLHSPCVYAAHTRMHLQGMHSSHHKWPR